MIDTIEIVETIPAHIRMMSKDIYDQKANKYLWRQYKRSIICKTAIFNGKVAAIWGVGGELFGNVGHPWLAMSPEVYENPMSIAFIYRKEVREFQRLYPLLEDYVDADEQGTLRMLKLMGFNLDYKRNAAPYVRAWRQ